MTGAVEALWITDEGSAPMESVERVQAIEGRGLEGDRYARGTGFYSGFDECEATLIEREAIETIRETGGIDLGDGRHRRNIVTRGIAVQDLLDVQFSIGTARLEGTRPRPPCAHVEDVADEEGVAQSLGQDRGGICARVIDSGDIGVGDDIECVEDVAPDPDGLAAAIRDRQG